MRDGSSERKCRFETAVFTTAAAPETILHHEVLQEPNNFTYRPTNPLFFNLMDFFFFYSELIFPNKDLGGCQLSASRFISDGRLEKQASSRLCGFTLNANTCCGFPIAESRTI